jgi:hypothetical protein
MIEHDLRDAKKHLLLKQEGFPLPASVSH